jgi:protein-tyrosine-phosphatase
MVRSNIRDRNILFLCHDNACLSPIAEAIAKEHLPPKTQVFSAGLKPGKIDPTTIQVLREIGIDLSAQEAKGLDAVPIPEIDLIIMVGEPSDSQSLPHARAKLRAWNISDPRETPGADLQAFRHLRDEIDSRVAGLFLDYWRNIV